MEAGEEWEKSRKLYSALGVGREASREELRAAFKRKARQTHPDRLGGKGASFDEATKAYQILSNSKSRILYNIFGDGILPVLYEGRYAVYIDCFVNRAIVALSILSAGLLALGTVFYPYILLLKRYGIITEWTTTLLPLAVGWIVGLGIGVRLLFMLGRRHGPASELKRIFAAVVKASAIVLEILALGLVSDRRLSPREGAVAFGVMEVLVLGSSAFSRAMYMEWRGGGTGAAKGWAKAVFRTANLLGFCVRSACFFAFPLDEVHLAGKLAILPVYLALSMATGGTRRDTGTLSLLLVCLVEGVAWIVLGMKRIGMLLSGVLWTIFALAVLAASLLARKGIRVVKSSAWAGVGARRYRLPGPSCPEARLASNNQ